MGKTYEAEDRNAALDLLISKMKNREPKGGLGETEVQQPKTSRLTSERKVRAKARRRRMARLYECVKRMRKELEELTEGTKKLVKKALKDQDECDRNTYWIRIQEEIREENKRMSTTSMKKCKAILGDGDRE